MTHCMSWAAVLASAVLFVGCATTGQTAKQGDQIVGTVYGESEGRAPRLQGVRVEVVPMGEDAPGWLGTAVSDENGFFEINHLIEKTTFLSKDLIRDVEYEVKIVGDEYYVDSLRFVYPGGRHVLELSLTPKVADVVDDTGVINEDRSAGSGFDGAKSPVKP